MSDVLKEAAAAVNGERQHSYGHPADNHGCTAALWSAWISRRTGLAVTLTAEDVCWLNVLQKASREANRAKFDNLTDTVGYVLNIEMIQRRSDE